MTLFSCRAIALLLPGNDLSARSLLQDIAITRQSCFDICDQEICRSSVMRVIAFTE